MKALKSKLAIGVITTGLVAGMGTAFAATDAGGQLQSWYNSATKVTKALVAGDVASFVASNKDKLVEDYNTINKTAVNDVKTAGTTETTRANTGINNQLSSYSNQLDTTKGAIAGAMPAEYDKVVSDANKINNTAVEVLGALGKLDIAKDVNNQGKSSLKSVDTDVTATKSAAATALTSKIEATKADLNKLLADERTAASQEIKDNLTAKITAKLAELQKLADELEATNVKAITDKGASIETASKAELETIVLNGLK
ncbi:hypothetical protein ACFPES_28195 [Paenibacillus sp. GCM10023248]|uniref:hypothetical protein n=1 Tax=Bacillales TaxID=1385 RepID=UPI002379D838|nr:MULTISPECIES: hypothetical protein [Bacillales]MDD9270935.1 hypothetical protein [Paenibacillus sp. MAHUQ-63]MDR6882930.1 hypothetical protein [Bacillus sp. 3255]